VFRVPDMEAALAKSFTAAAISGIKVAADDLMTDIHAGAEYRAHLIGVLARRAIAKALA
jgi:aerobic carbon-monoxide dehydrogenase medium subunit